MNRYLLPTLVAGLLIGVNASQCKAKEPVSDKESILGNWEVVSLMRNGGIKDLKATIEFTKSKFIFHLDEKVEPGEATYTLGPTTKPKSFDLTTDGETAHGIYELDGDKLRICLPYKSGLEKRSTAFESKPMSVNGTLIELRRVKK